jgi:drug/metabolite transporter (DMT)-like permease
LSKKSLKKVDPLQFTVLENLFGALPLLGMMFWSKSWLAFGHASVASIIALALLSTTNGAGAFLLFNYGVKRVHSDAAAEQNYIQTLLVCALAVALGEHASMSFLIGGVLVILGTMINHSHIHKIWWLHHLGALQSDMKKVLRAPELAFEYVASKHLP